jgi:hypothetical protein
MIESALGCYTPSGGSPQTIEILRTFMPDPANLGKTILTEVRYIKNTPTGPHPFVPDFTTDVITPGACPVPQVVATTVATGDLENACYQATAGGPITKIKIVTEVAPDGTLTVLGFSVPTLQPIAGFDPAKLVACPVTPCPTPTNTGVNPNW